MTILSVVPNVTGDVGIVPRIVRINTNDTVSTILSVGYCNNVPLQFGVNFTTADMILVASTDQGTDWYELDPAQPGITLKVASENDGNVLGPASSTTNAIVRWLNNGGRNIINSTAILDNSGSLSGLNIVSANAYIADLFQTRAGGEVSFSNPLGTFSTSFKAGANIADTLYTLPPAFPTINGQVLTCATAGVMTWTTNGAGDVVGPASATDTAIALFDTTTGKLLKNSLLLVSSLGDLTGGVNATWSGTVTGNNFTTLASGILRLRNPANTFNSGWTSGTVLADSVYIMPNAGPTLNDRPLVSATISGGFAQTRFADAIVIEQVTQAISVTMTRNKSYTSTNNGSRSTFTMPTSGFSVGDIFRVVGEGSSGWEFAVSGTMNIDAAGFGLTAGDKIQSTLYSDIAYVICTDATPGDEQFSLVIERGAFTLPTQSVVINSETEIPPIEVTTTSQTVVPGRTYFANNASLVTFTIPGTWPFGSWFAIDGKGIGKWRVQANTGQVIRAFGSATSSAGSLTATGQDDTIKIRCLTANILFTCEYIGGAGVVPA